MLMSAYRIANDGELDKVLQMTDFFKLMIICDPVKAKVETFQAM